MIQCSKFDRCSAPLCPLDPEINKRFWLVDEEICNSTEHKKHRWIKKQRSIVRRQTKSWLDKANTYQELFDASRPRVISEEDREKLVVRMNKMRGLD